MNNLNFTGVNNKPELKLISTKRTPSNGKNYKSYSDTQGDVYVPRKRTRHSHVKQNVAKGVVGCACALCLIAGGANLVNKLKPVEPNYNAHNHTASYVEVVTDVDARAILLANGIKSADEPLGEIILPYEYKVYEDEINNLEEQLSGKLSDKKREELTERLNELTNKQEEQDALATVYVDENGKYAYIIPTRGGISAETIKDAFGIKDGVIRTYNNLDFSWGVDGEGDTKGYYRDYTDSVVPSSGIRIPFDKLNSK